MNNVSRISLSENRVPKDLKFPVKLDLGCGQPELRRKDEGHIGMDIRDFGQEIVWDMEAGIPLPDRSCSQVYCSHVLEHVDDLYMVMNECWRVLEDWGVLWAIVPSKDHEKAHIPPHINLMDEWTFKFFTDESYTRNYGAAGKTWKMIQIVENERHDIHCKMTPKR